MAHVLLVEDNTPIRLLLTEFLETAGHRVEGASDGAEALERMRQDCPDAVVLDLQMPVLDGWSLLRTCRATPELAEVPAVVMSALDDAYTTVAALGVQRCLSKPFDLDQLAAALEDLGVETHASAPHCTYCGAETATRDLRVFTRAQPDDRWQLCDRCWMFLGVGFQAHRPAEDLEQRLSEPIPIHAAEARGWISTGLARVGRQSERTARQLAVSGSSPRGRRGESASIRST
jgi:CheY-like chemotaxis protein